MDKTQIQVGADWDLLRRAQEECHRVFDDLRHKRGTEWSTPQEAFDAGIVAAAFDVARDAIFTAMNYSDAYGDDQQAAEVIKALSASLPATRLLAEQQKEVAESTS